MATQPTSSIKRLALHAALAAALLTATAPAWSLQSGRTAQGQPFVSGGVSHEEQLALHQQRDAYSLWVVTAAQRSGANLADVRVQVRESKGQTVLDEALDGPWLFVALPLGQYIVKATCQGRTQERSTTIHLGDHHQVFFYFDTGDTLSDENKSPFSRNPYDTTRP